MSRPSQQVIRRRVRTAQVLLLVILVAGTAYVGDSVVGANIFRDPTTVTVELTGAGGLHDRSTVTYRGQHIGEVESVELTGDGVEATFEIEPGVEVPRDSGFVVANLSAVGEQYLDIRPRSNGGPWITDGAVIRADETSLPIPTYQVLAHAQRLLGRIDVADMETISAETEAIFGDGRADLRSLSREAETLLGTVRQMQPQLSTLLREAEQPLRTGVEQGDELRRISRNLSLVTRELRRSHPRIERLLDRADEMVPLLHSMWQELAPGLAEALAVVTPVARMARAHLPGLHHWLDWVPLQLEGMAGSTRDGSGRVMLVPKKVENCVYTDDQRPPRETSERRPRTDTRCTTDAPKIQQRGAKNVPRP